MQAEKSGSRRPRLKGEEGQGRREGERGGARLRDVSPVTLPHPIRPMTCELNQWINHGWISHLTL